MERSPAVGVREHFDEVSGVYYDVVDAVWYDVGYYHNREASFLRSCLLPSRNIAVDAGCGPGRHTATLARSSKRVIAVDISRKMLERVSQHLSGEERDRVELVQADVRSLPLKGNVADIVVNFEVLEHLPNGQPDVDAALREFRRVLSSDGWLVTEARLRMHSLWTKIYPKGPSWKEVPPETLVDHYARHPLRVAHAYSDNRIDRLLRDVGLKVRKKAFVRVLPAALIERFPRLGGIDRLLESVPLVRRFAREAMWCMSPIG